MSGLLDQAGLTAGSGLTNGAGLYKWGNFNPFDPTDLDPYLLFDTGAGSMIGTLENPTLDLDPSNQETLDVITATRSSVATRTLPDGTIALAEQDTVRVDYTQGAELTPTKFQHITNTDFSTGWFPSNITISTNQAIAPDGSQTAIKLVQNNVTNSQFYTRDLISGGDNTYTYSLYAKQADAGKHLYFELGNARASVNLNDGSIYYGPNTFSSGWSNPSVSVVALDDGWYRVAMTATASSSVSSFYAKNHVSILSGSGDGIINDGDGTSGIYLWGPQLEEGTTASDFVANTTGSPKFTGISATYAARVPMILVEPSATNLVTYSEDFSQSSWDKQSGGTGVAPAITSNDTIAPDGTQSADKVVFNKGAADDPSNYSILSDAFPSQQNTASLFIKADTNQRIVIRNSNSWVAYDVTTEWTRIEQTDTGGSLQIGLRDGYGIPNVPDTANVYLWGAQVEAGSVATSYIPTSGGDAAARTRAADQLSLSTSVTSSFFSSTGGGTFYAEFVPRDVLSEQWYLLAGQEYNRRFMYTNVNNTLLRAFDGTNTRTFGAAMVVNQLNRAAFTYTATTQEGSSDGATVPAVSHNGNYLTTTRLYLSDPDGGRQMNGHLKRLLFWPTHSSRL